MSIRRAGSAPSISPETLNPGIVAYRIAYTSYGFCVAPAILPASVASIISSAAIIALLCARNGRRLSIRQHPRLLARDPGGDRARQRRNADLVRRRRVHGARAAALPRDLRDRRRGLPGRQRHGGELAGHRRADA